MTVNMTEWLLYPNGGKGGRSMDGEFVTITPAGNTVISADLTDRFRGGRPAYMMIQLSGDKALLRLTPSRQPVDGSLKVMWPGGKGRGQQARIGTVSGFKVWGILPKEVVRCPARWDGESLVVELGKRFGGTETPPGAEVSGNETHGGGDAKAARFRTDDRPARCCGNCTWQNFRLCTCQDSERANTMVSLTDVCDVHFYGLSLRRPGETDPRPQRESHTVPEAKVCEPVRPGRRAATGEMGSRPRVKCPVGDHGGRTFAVSSRGIMPHDEDGVVYTAGRGDPARRCPGSGLRVEGLSV